MHPYKVKWVGDRKTAHVCVCGRTTRRGMLIQVGVRLFCSESCSSVN